MRRRMLAATGTQPLAEIGQFGIACACFWPKRTVGTRKIAVREGREEF
jgi:hypothetical protein